MTASRIDRWIEESEGLPSLTRESLRELQLTKLRDVLRREHEREGFYRKLPKTIGSLEELETFPFTTQGDLLGNSGSMLVAPPSAAARVVSDNTSGTAGKRKRLYYSDRDLLATMGFFRAGLGELVGPGDRVLIAMPRSGPNGLSALISAAVEGLDAVPLVADTKEGYALLESLVEKTAPRAFVGMPVQLLSFLRLCGGSGIRKAVVSADTLPRSVKTALERDYSVELFPHYGSRELCLGGACTCHAHSGMHLRENHVIAEIVDSRGRRVPDGQYGELVITTIGMELLPLIRYRTGDRARIVPGGCGCASVTTRIDGTRRIAREVDISFLDDSMFGIETLVDYEVSGGSEGLEVSATTLDGKGEARIMETLKALLGPARIGLSVSRASLDDGPKYEGKRAVRAAGREEPWLPAR